LQNTQWILAPTRLLHTRGMTNNLKFGVSPTCVAVAPEEVLLNDLGEPALLFFLCLCSFFIVASISITFGHFVHPYWPCVRTIPFIGSVKAAWVVFIEFRQAFMNHVLNFSRVRGWVVA